MAILTTAILTTAITYYGYLLWQACLEADHELRATYQMLVVQSGALPQDLNLTLPLTLTLALALTLTRCPHPHPHPHPHPRPHPHPHPDQVP